MRRRTRLLAVVFLLACLCGSFVVYGALDPVPQRNIFPGGADLAEEYDEYVGQRVTLSGTVRGVDPLVLETGDGRGGTATLTVVGTRRSPATGTQVNVLGRARPDGRIEADRTFVVANHELIYTYTTSGLAGMWVLARLIRRWRLRSDLAVVRRSTPLGSRWSDDSEGGDEGA